MLHIYIYIYIYDISSLRVNDLINDTHCLYTPYLSDMLIPVATRSNAWVCDRLLAGTAGSNPIEGMDVRLS